MSNPVFNKILPPLCDVLFHQVNTRVGEGTWEEAKAHARMRNDQLAIDIVATTIAKEEEEDKEIAVIPDHEVSQQIAGSILALWSQNGAEDMGAPWSAMYFHVTKECKMRLAFDPVENEEASEKEDRDSKYMSQVYDDRLDLYAKKFRNGEKLADQIMKMHNLFVVWPMGGLVQFKSSVLDNCHVMSTFGLTNPDMPAKLKSSPAPGSMGGFFMETKAPPPLPRVGMAGYGYEFLLLTREPADWAKFLLNAACNNQLLGDIEFLGSVEALGAVTMGNMPAGEKVVNILMAEAKNLLGEPMGQLLNGKMKFLVITIITEAEVKYRVEHGLAALMDLLDEKGVGQISDLDRVSVV